MRRPFWALLLCLLVTADAAWANVCQWTGAAAPDNKWSNPNNWTGCGDTFPQNRDTVHFPEGAAQPANVNDIPGLTLTSVVFFGPGRGPGSTSEQWNITGAGVTLTHNLQSFSVPDDAGHGPSFLLPITLGVNTTGSLQLLNNRNGLDGRASLQLGDIDLAGQGLLAILGSPVTVRGRISGRRDLTGSPSLQMFGPSILTLNDNSYSGSTHIQSGIVVAMTARALGASSGPQDGTRVIDDGTLVLSDGVVIDEAISVESGSRITVPTGASATITGLVDDDLIKIGGGTLVLSPVQSRLSTVVVNAGTLRIGVHGAIPNTTSLTLAAGTDVATLDLNNFDVTLRSLSGSDLGRILLGTGTLTINSDDAAISTIYAGTIAGAGHVVKRGAGALVFAGPQPNTYTGTTTVEAGRLELEKTAENATIVGPLVITGGVVESDADHQIADAAPVRVNAPGVFLFDSADRETIGSLTGNGEMNVEGATLSIGANNTSTAFDGALVGDTLIGGLPPDAYLRVIKVGTGTLTLTGNSTVRDQTVVDAGTLVIDGRLNGSGVLVRGGTLAGTGTILSSDGATTSVSHLIARGGAIGPGHSPGILHADAAELDQSAALVIELNGPAPGAGYDQLDLTGPLTLGTDARLVVSRGVFGPPKGSRFTIVALAAGKSVHGAFAGLPEGATLMVDRQPFGITYRGGDGNDVVLTALEDPAPLPITYYLSEGATGGFFDNDLLIANPHDEAAPVTLTFSTERGEQVVVTRTAPAQSHLTVHVDQIPGLEATAASAQVRSEAGVPLVVERSMFWDASYYAGHTGAAVDQPSPDWFFAEGSQGFFDTFVLVINPNATPADVTFTFFRENDAPVVKTFTLGEATRLTLYAGDVPELLNSSFGIAVHATQPIMAERAMYFTTPHRQWSGGHESAGVTAPSTRWFLAEGATGSFFDTFVLLSNPQPTPAQVTLTYLLDTGETVTVPKTIAANARLTINIEAEEDVRLHNAAVSTVVTADVPIIAERSMYWPGTAIPWSEGHNSFGVVDAGLHWGLAEGRTGGPLTFHTYILLTNPQSTAANVTVRFLRETGTPIIQTYTVPPTSRFNVDVNAVDGLQESSFGAVIEVTNGVPIVVERSMYWGTNGVQFSSGTNATGIRLTGRSSR